MEQHYAQAHYINDLEALIEHHQKQLLSAAAEQEAALNKNIRGCVLL